MQMAFQEQRSLYRHKRYSQRKRSRDDEDNTVTTFSTDSDSSLEADQENYTSNLPKQRKVYTTKLTPKQKFKIEKAINDLRIRIQLINLNDNNQPDQTKDDSQVNYGRERPLPSSTSNTDSNGNVLQTTPAKRGRPEVNTKNIDKESLSDDEINEKLIKLDIPMPIGPPPNRRVTFGGFSYAPTTEVTPKKKKLVTFEGEDNLPSKILKSTEPIEKERIKFSSKKMGRSRTIKEINIEDEWKIYKAANLSLSEFANKSASFGKK